MTVTICIIVGVLSVLLFNESAGTLNPGKINIASYSFYLIIIQAYIGCLLINCGFNKHYTLGYLLDRRSIDTTTYFLWILMLLLPLTMMVVYKLFRFEANREYEEYLNKEIEEKDDPIVFYVITAFAVIQLILLIYYFNEIGYVPLYKLIVHEAGFEFGTERIRIQGINLFNSGILTNLLIKLSIPFASYIAAAYMLASKRTKWGMLALILFIMSAFVKTIDFSKSPLVFYALVLVFICIFTKKGGLRAISVTVFGGSMAGLLLIVYKLQGYTGSFFDIYNGVIGRTLFTQFGTLCYHFDLFPKTFGYLHGRSLTPTVLKIIGIDPKLYLRSGKIVMAFYGSEKVYDGTAGVMNCLFMGEAYANWGVIGALLSIIWVGIVISLLFIAFVRIKKTPVSIAIFAFLTQLIGNATQSGFVDFLYNSTIIIVIVIGLLLLYYRKIWEWVRRHN